MPSLNAYQSPNCDFVIDDDNFDTADVRDELFPHANPGDDELFERGMLDLEETGYGDRYEGEYATNYDMELIPRSEWAERIKDMDATNSHLWKKALAAGVKVKSQKSTKYCWAFGATMAVQLARINQLGTHVELSPASVAARITGFVNRGGWARDVMKFGSEHGWVPTANWPDIAISRRYDTDANNALREHHQVDEWWKLKKKDFGQLMTNLLLGHGVSVAYMWWKHLVCAVRPVKLDGRDRFGVETVNSWGERWGNKGLRVFAEGKANPDEAYAPRVVTFTP